MTTNKTTAPTMDDLKAMVVNAGGTVLDAACWESESSMFAFSKETIPGTYGDSKFTASYDKVSGWTVGPNRSPYYKVQI